MIVIVDYGVGNLLSLSNALARLGKDVIVTSRPAAISKAERIILPGVGSFGEAAFHLSRDSLGTRLVESVGEGVPLLGICLGLQLLFEESEESEGVRGLGLLRGKVVRLPSSVKVPHMGWNRVRSSGGDWDFTGDRLYYFAHSFYCLPEESDVVRGVTDYGLEFPSLIQSGGVLGVQFHPEKSGRGGWEFLERWVGC